MCTLNSIALFYRRRQVFKHMTDNRLCSFAVYYLHHCVPHAQIVILDGTSGGVLWEVTLWATPNSPRPASIHTANGYSIFVFWGLKNDGNASVSASLLPKETSDAICPKTLIPVKMLVFSHSPLTGGSTCCILSIPKFSSRRPVLQVTLSNLKVIFFFFVLFGFSPTLSQLSSRSSCTEVMCFCFVFAFTSATLLERGRHAAYILLMGPGVQGADGTVFLSKWKLKQDVPQSNVLRIGTGGSSETSEDIKEAFNRLRFSDL